MPTPPTLATSRTDIAGIRPSDLARQFGTPTFVYDAAVILSRLTVLTVGQGRSMIGAVATRGRIGNRSIPGKSGSASARTSSSPM